MLKRAALIFGIVFIVIGILGFIPAATTAAAMDGDRLLLGIFEVNTWHNLIHLASGIVALFCCCNPFYSKRYFQIFGIVYGLVALLGIGDMDGPLLGLVAHNRADLWLHIVITLASLYLGFGYNGGMMGDMKGNAHMKHK